MGTSVLQPAVIRLVAGFLSLSGFGVEGYTYHVQRECRFNSHSLEGTEYIERRIFNKLEITRYNSTLGKFIGYTEIGVYNADRFNNDSGVMAGMKSNVDAVCKRNAQIEYDHILDKSVKPTVTVKATKPDGSSHEYMLVCSALGFFPRKIKVTWLRNGVEVKSGVTSTEEMSNGNWYYQIHSHWEMTPQSGETYACKVQHKSVSDQPIIVQWDPSMPESDRNKIIIGVSAIVLGLVIAVAGLIYYKKKSTGRILVPSS
ncbi:H-2 class II histocompatibility antigen, E-S beta chain-like [Erpetoichthys calabaricus]|uniref:H-2 class II histocompatibility antigen, E-S beta chain-like n=1 Tax=Erpetoichthys calabaricus TaxID=27687 RepID=A0A8C4T065_ERPCA|nr:H-2 class II histocompatibility antigen, E-S beta chain-like [Erpetoichthys calabaricus]